jgi:hypothetical protein
MYVRLGTYTVGWLGILILDSICFKMYNLSDSLFNLLKQENENSSQILASNGPRKTKVPT